MSDQTKKTGGLPDSNFRLYHIERPKSSYRSAWLGGVLLQVTGGYTVLWCLDMALCTFAGCMSFRIDRKHR